MNDMSSVIIPKSDQINADDLISGPITITITGVNITPGTEQPVSIRFEGDEGKPWRPCKSMSRVLVAAWGPDAKAYTGRSLTLYRDPKVKWGGLEVGGIRISHMSHIERDMVMALTETRGKRTPHKVAVLKDAPKQQDDPALKWANAYMARLDEITDPGELDTFAGSKAAKLEELRGKRPELHSTCAAALERRRQAIAPNDSQADDFADDPFGAPMQDDTPDTPFIPATLAKIEAAGDNDALDAIDGEINEAIASDIIAADDTGELYAAIARKRQEFRRAGRA